MTRKVLLFWPVLLTVFLADCTTKALVVDRIGGAPGPHEVLGSWLRFTLSYNTGAAMGIDLGTLSRLILGAVAVVAIALLARAYRHSSAAAPAYVIALALLTGGALGNLWDRLRWNRGVVDFIDVGVGSHRFWIFNVADLSLTVGVVILLGLSWRGTLTPSRPIPFDSSR